MTKMKLESVLEIVQLRGRNHAVIRIEFDGTTQQVGAPTTKREAFARAREIAATTGERVRKAGER